MDLAAARQSFPALRDKVFLDAATVSLAPVQARQAIGAFVESAVMCFERDASTHHVAMDELRIAAVTEAARLLNADEDEIALVESTTHGLNVAALALPLSPDDNVLVSDLEFPQVALPWMKLREQGAIAEVRFVPHVDGAVTPESFSARVDARTRVICVSSVQWSHGYRVDLAALGALCRDHDAFLVVDAIQQLGAVRLDVRATPADFVIAGGHKWLNAPFGCGVMYVRRDLQERLRQPTWGYLGLEPPEGGWPRYFETPSISPDRPYRFAAGAKRFEMNGTSNYPGVVGLGASLKLINRIGIETVERHVLSLGDRLRGGLTDAGVNIVSRPEPQARSAITTFTLGSVEADGALHARLLDERILVARRYTAHVGGIRVSTHYFNNADDVERLIAAVRAAAHARRSAQRRQA
jgi:cysteine desulfurase/selenocysteine lyase